MSRKVIPPTAGRCKPSPLGPRHINTFAEHAGVEAIQEQISARRAEVRPLERHIDWLEHLLKTRQAQIEAGVWPPTE